MALHLIYSSHSLEQFTSRSDPEMTHAEAQEILERELSTAQWLEQRTRTGERYLYFPYIGYCLIIKRDGRDLIAVTCVKSDRQVPSVNNTLLKLDTYTEVANQNSTVKKRYMGGG